MFGTKAIAIAALAVATIGIQSASAIDRGHGYHGRYASEIHINHRIARQARRIYRGRDTGRLNWVEARKLRFELSHIRGFKQTYMRDGWLNRREARHLNQLLNRNDRRIRYLATNGPRDWRSGRRYGRDYRRAEVGLRRYDGFQ